MKSKLVVAAVISFIFFLPAFTFAQKAVELNLGAGYKANYTPPSGWTKGTCSDNEQCFHMPGNAASVYISTSWKRDRTAEKILDESIGTLPVIACETKNKKTSVAYIYWKECQVNVGPRKEGRIWMVITYKDTRNAIMVSVHLQKWNDDIRSTVSKSVEMIKFIDPVKQ